MLKLKINDLPSRNYLIEKIKEKSLIYMDCD
jgi:hypothetical protein